MTKCTKGIILAGGTGSRLYPLTIAVNKQLLPIFDKPALYYPLTSLMLAGIRDILVISSPDDLQAIQSLLGDGAQFGLSLHYVAQESPRGLPEAFILGKDFINNEPVAMILGDNFFYGQGFSALLEQSAGSGDQAHVFLYGVKDPSRYGVAKFDAQGKLTEVVEKPKDFISPWAITGLYFFPGDVAEAAAVLKPSARGELEITDLLRHYIKEGRITTSQLGRGNVWFDIGTPESMLQASSFVEMIQNRQRLLISSPEEVAWRMGWISTEAYKERISALPACSYRSSLELALIS